MQQHVRKRPRQSDDSRSSGASNNGGGGRLLTRHASLVNSTSAGGAVPSSSSSSPPLPPSSLMTARDLFWQHKTTEVQKQLVQLAKLYTQKTQEHEEVLDAMEEMISEHEAELAVITADIETHTRQHLEAMSDLRRRENACLIKKQQAMEEMNELQERYSTLERDRESLQEDLVMKSDALEQLQKLLETQRQQTAEEQQRLDEVMQREHLMRDGSHGLSAEVKKMVDELQQIRRAKEAAEHKAREKELLRRQLYSQCEELKGTIRVYCRVKGGKNAREDAPFSAETLREGSVSSYSTISSLVDMRQGYVTAAAAAGGGGGGGGRRKRAAQQPIQYGRFEFPKTGEDFQKTLCVCQSRNNATSTGKQESKETFVFDRVFDGSSTQEDVYAEVEPLVNCAIDGYRVCIFAYGQTGSGKTYSMEGDVLEEHRWGITPRALRTMFRRVDELKSDGWCYEIRCYLLEIYNDVIRDLQQEPSVYEPGGVAASQPNYHTVKHHSETGSTSITGVVETRIYTFEDFQRLYEAAMRNRSTSKTMLNDRSSRSHCIFVLRIEGENAGLRQRSEGTLCLVDLAGSERVNDSGVQGQQFKEAVNINRSLLDLGKCISALNNSGSVAPWRNCKLTYLLQNYLGAKGSKMLMLVTVSDREEHLAESLNSLRFANRVNQTVVGVPVRRVNNY